MSSYNGERFIEEQIDSILHQKGVEVSLYIRDDGSTDGTGEILDRYAAGDNVHVSYGENLGVGRSFMSLLYSVPDGYDYYALSDQDDIWYEDKLITAVRRLDRESGILYTSNLECIDGGGKKLGMKFESGEIRDTGLLSVICRNRFYGCSLVFPEELVRLLKDRRPSEKLFRIIIHDTWICISAAAVGKILYDEEAHIRYRRHNKNVSVFKLTKKEIWKRRLSNLRNPDQFRRRSITAAEVIKCYPEYVNKNEEKEMICYLAGAGSAGNKPALIRNREKIISVTKETDVRFITKVLIGLV